MIPAHGGQLRSLAAQYGLDPAAILDFSANINPDGPPASVVAALHAALEKPATLSAYPDLELKELRSALAAHLIVAPQSIAIANGFVPLLEAVVRSLNLRRCLLPVPAFGEYRRTLELCGAVVIAVALKDKFRYDTEALIASARAADADAILIANPQNPSGRLTSAEDLRQLIQQAAEANLHVLLDEAFIDYAPGVSLTQFAPSYANLVVFRSVTKFYAMPGLRVAYAVMPSAERVNRSLPPWPVSTLAAEATIAALADRHYEHQAQALNEQRRHTLEQGLDAIGIETFPPAANFLLLRVPNAPAVWETLLRDHQILLRSCSNFEGLGNGFLRTAVRSEVDNQRLLSALRLIVNQIKPSP